MSHTGSCAPTTARRDDPRRSRLLPVPGPGRPGHLRRQGQVAAQRLSNYFQNPANLPPRTAQMVAPAETVEWIQVRNDVEALMLEYSLIKQHKPRFNVRLRDDKSYPFLAVTVSDEWPRAMVRRGDQGQGQPLLRPLRPRLRHPRDARLAAAHVPDPHAAATTSSTRHQRLGRPCLLYHIEKCSGPCVRPIDHDRLRPAWSRSWSPSSTATPQPVIKRLGGGDARGRPTASSSNGRPGCATG